MARFRHIIGNRNFSLLWVGQIISQFGDRLDQMALIALLYRFAPGSTTQMAKLMAFTIIPVFLIGPIAGVYVDRWDRRRTMVICDLLRGILILLIPLYFIRVHSLLPIYTIVFLAFSIGRFYVPAKMAIIPDLVKNDDLLLANSLVNTTGMIAAMFGLGLGGILVGIVGAEGGFLIDGISFLISGCLIFFLSTKAIRELKKERILVVSKEIAEVIKKSVISEMKDAIHFLKNQDQIRSCFGILFLLWGALGSMYVVSIVFIQKTFSSATKEVGFLVVALGFGLFLGTLGYGRLGQKTSGFKTIFVCIFLSGIVLGTFVLAVLNTPNLLMALVLVMMLGLVVSPIMSISNTLVQQFTDNSMRGKVFSSLEIVMHAAFLLFMLISASLADRIGSVKILLSVSGVLALIGLIGIIAPYGKKLRKILVRLLKKIPWKKMNKAKLAAIVIMVCLIAPGVVSVVSNATQKKISDRYLRRQVGSLTEVFPAAAYSLPVMENGQVTYDKVFDINKHLLGYAFLASKRGYSSDILTLVGMNKNGVITKIKILTQNETPGLGTKILAISKKETDWQKILRKYGLLPLQQPDFQAQFVGKKVETLGARVAVITGATVTSKAVIESIQAKGQDIMNRVKNEK